MIRASKLLTNFPKSANVVARNFGMTTPPRVRVSITEKVLHGFVFTIGILAIPAYISVNIKNYRGPVE